MLEHPDSAIVSFGGSTAVDEHIYGTAAANGKHVWALGGAMNHIDVTEAADLEPGGEDGLLGVFPWW